MAHRSHISPVVRFSFCILFTLACHCGVVVQGSHVDLVDLGSGPQAETQNAASINKAVEPAVDPLASAPAPTTTTTGDADADADAAATNQTMKNATMDIKKQLEKWSSQIVGLKSKLSKASAASAHAKKKADAAIAADSALNQKYEENQAAANKEAAAAAAEQQKVEEETKSVDAKRLRDLSKDVEHTKAASKNATGSIKQVDRDEEKATSTYNAAMKEYALKGGNFSAIKEKAERVNRASNTAQQVKAQAIAAEAKAQDAVEKLSDKEDEEPPMDVIANAAKAEDKAIEATSKSNTEHIKALTIIAKAQEATQAKVKEEQAYVHKISKLKAQADEGERQIRQEKEKTARATINKSEKESKLEALNGMRKRAEAAVDANEEDFTLATMANKLRAARQTHEVARKKEQTIGHTLNVMKEIDAAAKKEAKMIQSYRNKESDSKLKAAKNMDAGQAKLKAQEKALEKVTETLVEGSGRL